MWKRPKIGGPPRSATVGLLIAALVVTAAGAAEPPQEAMVRARLEAGEFAPALQLAQRANDPQKRNAWLAQIATSQARVGAREASLQSLAEIGDDRIRARALSDVAAEPLGGSGGAAQADFDSLIDLITQTVAPDTWDEVGGPGSIASFPTGVYVDAEGVLQPLLKQQPDGRLDALRAASGVGQARRDHVRNSSPLRKVSLPRLEKHLQLRLAAGRPPSEAMQVLAGLQRIRYVFVYPDTGDIVLAGPAGDWETDDEDRVVDTQSGQPVVRLDDLVVVLRQIISEPDARFGCRIVPRQEALASVQGFLERSRHTSIDARRRRAWLGQLRSHLGKQDIEVYGLDASTRAARVMVEADYRMKLVGMGLEEGVPGVQSYLDLVEVPRGQAPPPMGVLRWWFTLNYQSVLADEDLSAFAIRGQGVQVLSENELLSAEGQRIHTGKSEALNRQFAASFTEHFEALCEKYPVYAELRNLFDLALVAALLRQQGLPEKVGWHMTCFGDPGAYPVELGAAPTQVETVVNHRVVNGVHILAGISGGVRVAPASLVVRQAMEIDNYGALTDRRSAAVAKEGPADMWWWD